MRQCRGEDIPRGRSTTPRLDDSSLTSECSDPLLISTPSASPAQRPQTAIPGLFASRAHLPVREPTSPASAAQTSFLGVAPPAPAATRSLGSCGVLPARDPPPRQGAAPRLSSYPPRRGARAKSCKPLAQPFASLRQRDLSCGSRRRSRKSWCRLGVVSDQA